jgi:sucrose-6-phosphate hydrolase SacC (GH32 family)
MTWGHAVSPDLVHWTQLVNAIEPDALGTIYSGSAVVDWQNTSGFQRGDEHPLVAFYTSAGSHAPEPRPFTQSCAYSNDRGRSWVKYSGNPIVEHIRASNRDPKVIWHEPSRQWVMALFLDGNDYTLLGSQNIKEWRRLCDLTLPGVSECPDFFPLGVDGDPDEVRWVFWGAAGGYRLGTFDGTEFHSETDVLHAELGANGYAAQTWSDTPDGRRIQISWMAGGKYPAMPFNQQMSFPVELTLRTTPEGIRLYREPIEEIARLHERVHRYGDRALIPGQNLIPDTDCQLFDIRAEIEVGRASAWGALIRGHDLRYDAAKEELSAFGKTARLAPVDGRIWLQLLVDRTSLEVFGDDGRVSMSFCFLPEAADHNVELYAEGGEAHIVSLEAHELHSAWQ